MTNECEHGSLARQRPRCEDANTIKMLRATLELSRQELLLAGAAGWYCEVMMATEYFDPSTVVSAIDKALKDSA